MPQVEAPGLAVLWVTQDKEAAMNMALMYTKNSKLKGWMGKPMTKMLKEGWSIISV